MFSSVHHEETLAFLCLTLRQTVSAWCAQRISSSRTNLSDTTRIAPLAPLRYVAKTICTVIPQTFPSRQRYDILVLYVDALIILGKVRTSP